MAREYSSLWRHPDRRVVHDDLARWEAPLGWIARLHQAERLLSGDPDAAALLLDGALWGLAEYAFQRAGQPVPDRGSVLEALNALAPHVCWRLRLALRAPDPRARLIHAWALVEAVGGAPAAGVISEESHIAG